MKKGLLILPISYLFITIGCNLPPSGEPHSGPNGIFSKSEYMIGNTKGGASIIFKGPFEYDASIYGPNFPDEKCRTKGSYTYDPNTYIITIHEPDWQYTSYERDGCSDVDDPSPAGKWEYKGNHIISPTGKKFYYRKFSDKWQ